MRLKTRRDVVLLLTHSGDHFTVERVAKALSRKGARPFRFDTDLFPAKLRLCSEFCVDEISHKVRARPKDLSTDQVRAVWARKIWQPRFADDLDPAFREVCANESLAALEGFFDGLHGARWINQPARERDAENKLLQLRIARLAGLTIPRTLVTNDPQSARRFFAEVDRQMVAKLLRPVSMSMGPASSFVFTNQVTSSDLLQASLLRHSPMVFQELIPKARELRVVFVAGRLFTGAINSSASARGQVDWRRASVHEITWEPTEIPAGLARALKRLMSKLGLAYGAIDLIQNPDGDFVFLEVNPSGEWGMLERDLSYPIAESIADALLE